MAASPKKILEGKIKLPQPLLINLINDCKEERNYRPYVWNQNGTMKCGCA